MQSAASKWQVTLTLAVQAGETGVHVLRLEWHGEGGEKNRPEFCTDMRTSRKGTEAIARIDHVYHMCMVDHVFLSTEYHLF